MIRESLSCDATRQRFALRMLQSQLIALDHQWKLDDVSRSSVNASMDCTGSLWFTSFQLKLNVSKLVPLQMGASFHWLTPFSDTWGTFASSYSTLDRVVVT